MSECMKPQKVQPQNAWNEVRLDFNAEDNTDN